MPKISPKLPEIPLKITGFISTEDAIKYLPHLTNVERWDTSRNQIELHLYPEQSKAILALLARESRGTSTNQK